MKLLIVTGIFPPDIGGPASYAQAVAAKLSKTHTVTVVAYSSVFSAETDRQSSYRILRVWKKWPWLFRHILYLMKVFWQAGRHDTVLALNAIGAGTAGLLAAKFFKKKFRVRIAGDYAWETAVNRGRTSLLLNDFQLLPRRGWVGLLHSLQTWVCRNSSAIIVPSYYLAGLVEGWGIQSDKIHVIYNGVDFSPAQLSREDARKHIGIPGNIILSAGRLVPWKGFRMLIKIMPQLLQINQFFRLVIVGDGPDRNVLESMIKNLGLTKKVYLVGRKSQQELVLFLAATDMFVLNSGYEGFSHQLLEVMQTGVPIIASGVGGNTEVLRQGENAFMVKYNDEFNLVEAIRTLWQLPDVRQQFVEEGKKTAKEFTFEKMLRQTENLLTE